MNDDSDFFTETMARVYFDQGYFDKAVEIYRYLLKREPDRKDLIEKLSAIENKIYEKENSGNKHLVPLFNQWIDLVLRNNKLKRLQQVSRSATMNSNRLADE